MSNTFELYSTYFSRGGGNFLGGFAHLRPPIYGPDYIIQLLK